MALEGDFAGPVRWRFTGEDEQVLDGDDLAVAVAEAGDTATTNSATAFLAAVRDGDAGLTRRSPRRCPPTGWSTPSTPRPPPGVTWCIPTGRDRLQSAELGIVTGEPNADQVVPDQAAPRNEARSPGWRDRLRRVDRWLLAVVALGAAVRLWGLGAQSLWYDEWLTSRAASGDLTYLRGYVTGQAGIPPTYFAIMWVWARLVGDGDAALRSFSALVGVATIPVAYATVRELGRRRAVARGAALLVAVHPALVWYSQEARPYSLLALLGALSLWALARLWTRRGRRDLVAWAVVCALAMAVHYFAVFLVVAEALAVLVARRPARRDLLAAGAAAGVVLALLAPFAVRQLPRGETTTGSPTTASATG